MQHQKISGHIRDFGWHCLHVFPTHEGKDKFTYSIGFGESYGAPEIMIFGLTREKAHPLLGECAQLLKGGHSISLNVEDGSVLAGDYKVVFKPVRSDHFSNYLGTAVRYFQDKQFAAVVMFLPDKQHRFPWDAGYDGISADEALAIV